MKSRLRLVLTALALIVAHEIFVLRTVKRALHGKKNVPQAIWNGPAARHLTGSKDLRITASFDRVVGLYEGDDVRILGVKVGTVTSIDRQTS